MKKYNSGEGFKSRVIKPGAALLLAGSLLVGACSSGNSEKPTPKPSVNNTTAILPEIATNTTQLSEHQRHIIDPSLGYSNTSLPSSSAEINERLKLVARNHFASPERNARLGSVVGDAGLKIIQAAKTGQIGAFDFYNYDTDEWSSRAKRTTGWGALQHNPQYGGSPDQVIMTVFRNSNGTFDTGRGILELNIKPEGKPSVDMQAGSITPTPEQPITDYPVWEVRSLSEIFDGSAVATELNTTLASIQKADETAIARVSTYMQELGLR